GVFSANKVATADMRCLRRRTPSSDAGPVPASPTNSANKPFCLGVRADSLVSRPDVIRKNLRPARPSGNRALQAVFTPTGAAAKRALGFSVTDALLFQETEEQATEASPFTKRAIPLSLAIEANPVLACAVPENVI